MLDLDDMRGKFARHRRLRRKESIRRLVKETRVTVDSLVYPLFVKEGIEGREEIPTMKGVFRFSIEEAIEEIEEAKELGINSFLLFGIPSRKDGRGSEAYGRNGIVQRTIRRIKESVGDSILLISDVCLCQYTDHGHCGLVDNGVIKNDETLELLGLIALSHAEAGADVVAPSAMMDGQVSVIRQTLDKNGYEEIAVMGYSAKYSSVFYGPFREAAYSAPRFSDRRTYQMDPCNSREALREIYEDIQEGADIVMVKPALAYLDVIAKARRAFKHPIAAYNVSGEYSMIKSSVEQGLFDEKQVVYEVLAAIKRAGADIIITYFARDFARWRREGRI